LQILQGYYLQSLTNIQGNYLHYYLSAVYDSSIMTESGYFFTVVSEVSDHTKFFLCIAGKAIQKIRPFASVYKGIIRASPANKLCLLQHLVLIWVDTYEDINFFFL